jgi:hypothetical protein
MLDYGECDATLFTPNGTNTAAVDRAELGNVSYVNDIYKCTVAGDVALTFVSLPYYAPIFCWQQGTHV